MDSPSAPGKVVSYDGYLHIPELLSLQQLRSQPPTHDEMLFIIVHQAFELWFRQIRHEVDSLLGLLSKGDLFASVRRLQRLIAIIEVFDRQIGVLETMSPQEFSKFRDLLKPASGFQSWQFRDVEFACGARDDRYLRLFESQPEIHARLKARLSSPTLWEAFCGTLRGRGFAVGDAKEQRAAIVRIYREEQTDFITLCEAMIEFDEQFSLWREHHVRMAERMIGSKPGTGQHHVEYSLGKSGPMGAAGVDYLRSTLSKRFFPVLWEARSEL